jgi:hypothetical protein
MLVASIPAVLRALARDLQLSDTTNKSVVRAATSAPAINHVVKQMAGLCTPPEPGEYTPFDRRD